ncbi:nucleotidyltransferase [Rhodanobacter sp. DHG33]|uniref:nucleotidyltransferase domain-containing protein n=1 Tax=Rhodanobacter sp. DHG33 TaxID=2775921 RepID=UPI001781532F|nr:nucleotidyltransferase [Rhodanobacter sp. DHG33]MBD8898578.1 nucleotidyltransferase [Rhodanobacter sp. DHG33]
MAIPEAQLETWSHQGSISQSSTTYHLIKNVLEANATPYSGKNFEVFLQGSYGNDTNIYAESDVDIVICLNDCYERDLSRLTDAERAAYISVVSSATYGHVHFKRDVTSVLTRQYGNTVNVGDKAIAIEAGATRRKADVIAAIQFREYFKFRSAADSDYAEGICFYNSKGERIANYPKQHSANLTTKHQMTSERLKPMARIFKNMRSRMVGAGIIKDGVAPSYYLEGLLYNVPNEKFASNYRTSVVNVLNWYRNEASKAHLLCANERYYLLRDGQHTCWTQANCDAFVEGAVELWNGW